MNTNTVAIVTVFLEDDTIVKLVHKVSLFGSNVGVLAHKKRHQHIRLATFIKSF